MSEKMNPDSSSPPTISSTPAWLMLVRALLAVAIVGASYLAWVAIHNGPVAGCGPESGCDKVLHSRWAYWLDVPVSVPALLVYLALLGATVLLQKRPAPDDERGSWAAIITLSVIVAGAALWFVGLQVFVLKAFCKFCMTAHACGFIAALLCLKHIPLATDPDTRMWSTGSGKRGVPGSAVFLLGLIGMAGIVVLAGGQLLVQKKLNVVKDLRPRIGQGAKGVAATTGPQATNYLAQAAALAAQAPQPPAPNVRLVSPRLLSLYSNAFVLKLDEVPMMGSPDASNIIVSLFDYTCPHCRSLHPIMLETQRQFGNRLGIVCLPMPISTNCNPFMPPSIHSVSNSCEYVRLGLAVWRAKPAAFRQFDDWMFGPDRPVPVDQARAYAAQLVGADKLQTALADAWIPQQLVTDCRLHYTNWIVAGSPEMPQVILGDAVSSGPLNSVEHLMILLNHYLGLTPPAGAGP
ncbi:MAG: vitamin K epoxide reductase family protein [Planctomycetota bacterium]